MLTVHWYKASNRRRAGHTDGHSSIFSYFSKILQRTFARVLAYIRSMQKDMGTGGVCGFFLLSRLNHSRKVE